MLNDFPLFNGGPESFEFGKRSLLTDSFDWLWITLDAVVEGHFRLFNVGFAKLPV